MNELEQKLTEIQQEKQQKIIPDNIKKGVQIFDVVGNFEPAAPGVKLFTTHENMEADTTATEGDLAIIYTDQLVNMSGTSESQYITFPETVTLPQPFTYSLYGTIRASDSSIMFDGQINLDSTSFTFQANSETLTILVGYKSTDGITYTREKFTGSDNQNLTNPVDMQYPIVYQPPQPWNDNFGHFMQVPGKMFNGFYTYKNNSWNLAPTQFSATPDDVYSATAYGINGPINGTLQNTDNLTIDQINRRITIWNNFGKDNVFVAPEDCSSLFANNSNIYTIPLLNTSNTIDMSSMFSICTSLQSIPLLDTSNVTNMRLMFYGCSNLKTIPLLNTSNVSDMHSMFSGCSNLQSVPVFDMSNMTGYEELNNIFDNCQDLTDDSLNNIMAMCVTAVSYKGIKTLRTLGLTQEQATKCTTLPNYQAFTTAGWTTGY